MLLPLSNAGHLTEAQRAFMDNVSPCPNTGCWLWSSETTGNGYDVAHFNGMRFSAQRLAYSLWKGPIPSGFQVRHKCDQPSCVNPDHLEFGMQTAPSLAGWTWSAANI